MRSHLPLLLLLSLGICFSDGAANNYYLSSSFRDLGEDVAVDVVAADPLVDSPAGGDEEKVVDSIIDDAAADDNKAVEGGGNSAGEEAEAGNAGAAGTASAVADSKAAPVEADGDSGSAALANEVPNEGETALPEIKNSSFAESALAVFLAFLGSLSGFFISIAVIYRHLLNYTQPDLQRWIVRVLLVTPIYAVFSFCSLVFSRWFLYFDTIRDLYEAVVIYAFLALVLQYCGGENACAQSIQQNPGSIPHAWPLNWCIRRDFWLIRREIPLNPRFVKWCKRATLQFVFVKPIMAFAAIVLFVNNLYDTYTWRIFEGVVINICYTVALYALVLFYMATKQHPLLASTKALRKFMAVKIIIFATFWQSVVISLIPDIDPHIARLWTNFILCVELPLISVLQLWAFPTSEFKDTFSSTHLASPTFGRASDTVGADKLEADSSFMTAATAASSGFKPPPPPPPPPPPTDDLGVPEIRGRPLDETSSEEGDPSTGAALHEEHSEIPPNTDDATVVVARAASNDRRTASGTRGGGTVERVEDLGPASAAQQHGEGSGRSSRTPSGARKVGIEMSSVRVARAGSQDSSDTSRQAQSTASQATQLAGPPGAPPVPPPPPAPPAPPPGASADISHPGGPQSAGGSPRMARKGGASQDGVSGGGEAVGDSLGSRQKTVVAELLGGPWRKVQAQLHLDKEARRVAMHNVRDVVNVDDVMKDAYYNFSSKYGKHSLLASKVTDSDEEHGNDGAQQYEDSGGGAGSPADGTGSGTEGEPSGSSHQRMPADPFAADLAFGNPLIVESSRDVRKPGSRRKQTTSQTAYQTGEYYATSMLDDQVLLDNDQDRNPSAASSPKVEPAEQRENFNADDDEDFWNSSKGRLGDGSSYAFVNSHGRWVGEGGVDRPDSGGGDVDDVPLQRLSPPPPGSGRQRGIEPIELNTHNFTPFESAPPVKPSGGAATTSKLVAADGAVVVAEDDNTFEFGDDGDRGDDGDGGLSLSTGVEKEVNRDFSEVEAVGHDDTESVQHRDDDVGVHGVVEDGEDIFSDASSGGDVTGVEKKEVIDDDGELGDGRWRAIKDQSWGMTNGDVMDLDDDNSNGDDEEDLSTFKIGD